MSGTSEIVYQGWLTKSPPAKGIFRPRWRRRWFVLRTGPFPNQFVLEYFTDESCRRPKGEINLDECEQLVGPLAVQDRHRHTFHLRTPRRTYFLAADTDTEMSKWVAGLCQVCGLKTMEEEGEGTVVYSRAGDENNQPTMRQNHEEATESDESSPTLSNKIPSGPYIPISECFTGKPIAFNDKPDGQDVTYCNTTVFQFPPKVNWATHPTKRDHSDMETTPSDSKNLQPPSGVAPPRPPKKGSPAVIVSSEQSSTVADSIKAPSTPFDAEEAHDSSSTCSSLHSPPGSAGVLYCNISEITDPKNSGVSANQNGGVLSSSSQGLKANSSSTTTSTGTPPPVVDRNLKPLRRESVESSFKSPSSHISPTQKQPTPSYVSGTMTLPSRNVQNHRNPAFHAGPVIDRSRKPGEWPLTLGPTPVQIKIQGQAIQSSSHSYNRGMVGTLPSSPHRRAGPVVSPSDKKPIYHEYEPAPELKGTYLQIDCQSNKEGDSPKFSTGTKPSGKKLPGFHSDNSGSVEYRLIDPVKTKALNKTREDRERQLRKSTNNTISKNLH